jgi:NTP pyrophosphatase (non-canonical NTP hydrolase)
MLYVTRDELLAVFNPAIFANDLVMHDVWRCIENSLSAHPRGVPTDPLRQAALVAEEAGEVVKAALDATRGNLQNWQEEGALGDMEEELAQCAAMAILVLVAIQCRRQHGTTTDS